MRSVVFRVAAARDVEEAYLWYEAQRAGLGEEFLSSVAATTELLAASALAFPVVYRDTRRALLRRFPYGLFYRLVGDEAAFPC